MSGGEVWETLSVLQTSSTVSSRLARAGVPRGCTGPRPLLTFKLQANDAERKHQNFRISKNAGGRATIIIKPNDNKQHNHKGTCQVSSAVTQTPVTRTVRELITLGAGQEALRHSSPYGLKVTARQITSLTRVRK